MWGGPIASATNRHGREAVADGGGVAAPPRGTTWIFRGADRREHEAESSDANPAASQPPRLASTEYPRRNRGGVECRTLEKVL